MSDVGRKILARSRSRNLALGVIIPHVLGAVEQLGREIRLGAHHVGRRADSGRYAVETWQNPSGLYFCVISSNQRMMTGS